MALTLLLGGARSGKSALAERLAAASGAPVSVIATARGGSDGMDERIARHRADRPPAWRTIEEPADLAGALAGAGPGCVIVDCLTVWVGNLMHEGHSPEAIEARSREVAAIAAARLEATIVVSNEVGMGVHPATEIGMAYRDLLGRVNAAWAGRAARVLLLVAGRVVTALPPEAAIAELRAPASP